ncbi:hypothetical protein [Candidatus Sororendozoicomonas aggregata]|uniref:hypothetical protein n=1 Tax=Candidatus Sororendozoicomonas aggregata TaxID=3073239 RepID=UPI002ED3250D
MDCFTTSNVAPPADKRQSLVLLSANTHTVVIPIYQKMDSRLRGSDQSDGCMSINACSHWYWKLTPLKESRSLWCRSTL